MEEPQQEKVVEGTQVPIEYHLFGLAMTQEGAIGRFVEELSPESVGKVHGNQGTHEFYLALINFYDKTGLDIVDPIAFKTWLGEETDILEALGGLLVLDEFIEVILAQDYADTDAVIKIIRHNARKRKQLDSLQELQTLVNSKKNKSDQDIERIGRLTEQIRDLESSMDYNPLDAVLTADDIVDNIDSVFEKPAFIPTQFKSLNRAMGYTDKGGFFRGAVHAIIAQSGKGKSTLAKSLVNFWVDEGYSALFVNFEEPEDHWNKILMTQVIGENVYEKLESWSEEEKQAKADEFSTRLRGWGNRLMVRHDPGSSYYTDLEKWLRDILGHNDRIPDIVVIDTIQSMIMKGGGPRWEGFEQMMISMERLAKDMNAAFIITAQENANRMREGREVVMQSDTGGSIAIQQKCSVTIFITPEKTVVDDDSIEAERMQLQIPKNRFTGSSFSYDPPIVLYNDSTKSYQEWIEVEDQDYTMQPQAKELSFDEGFLT